MCTGPICMSPKLLKPFWVISPKFRYCSLNLDCWQREDLICFLSVLAQISSPRVCFQRFLLSLPKVGLRFSYANLTRTFIKT